MQKMEENKNSYDESPLVKAMPVVMAVIEAERCKKDFYFWYDKYIRDTNPEDFRRQYLQELVQENLIDTLLPENESEVILVYGWHSHLDFFIRKLSDYLRKDLRKNYRLLSHYSDIRGRKKLIILNGGRVDREGNRSEREGKILDEISIGVKRCLNVICVDDRDLDKFIK